MNITKNFSLRELTYSQTAIKNGIPNIPTDPEVLANLKTLCEKVLQPLRDGLGYSIRISSGYRSLALNKYVRLENIESEKYGRILADVYIGDVHLNGLLLKERYAVKYDGGTKITPTSWAKYRVTGEM